MNKKVRIMFSNKSVKSLDSKDLKEIMIYKTDGSTITIYPNEIVIEDGMIIEEDK